MRSLTSWERRLYIVIVIKPLDACTFVAQVLLYYWLEMILLDRQQL